MTRTLPLIVLLLLPGCGPRLEVAREQVLRQIDSLLGEIDVKSRQANDAVGQLARGVDQLTRARIDVEVRHTRLAEDLTSVQEKLSRTQDGHSRQTLQSEAVSLQTTKDRLGRVLGLLESRERQARDRLHALRILLAGIDSKRVALKSLRRAVEVCESGTLDFRRVEMEVRDLETQIDTELQFQELRLSDLSVDWE